METIYKYPRTPHLEGSRLQQGDEDISQIPFSAIRGLNIVYEEKVDGSNSAISFDHGGELLLQSRGHFLKGGDHGHFNEFKRWAEAHSDLFLDRLEDRYVMYGEWCFAKHTVFYDRLDHYFLEFDILDKATGAFLSTDARADLLDGLPVRSVPVLYQGPATTLKDMTTLIRRSVFMSETPDSDRWVKWQNSLAKEVERVNSAARSKADLVGAAEVVASDGFLERFGFPEIDSPRLVALRDAAVAAGEDVRRVFAETDLSGVAEGIYGKVEEDGKVVGRFKWVRHGFLQTVVTSGSHWLKRGIVRNELDPDVDLYADLKNSCGMVTHDYEGFPAWRWRA